MRTTPNGSLIPPWSEDDDTQTTRRVQYQMLSDLVVAHHERKGSERVLKLLMSFALGVIVIVGGGLVVMKADIAGLSARVDDLAKQVERSLNR